MSLDNDQLDTHLIYFTIRLLCFIINIMLYVIILFILFYYYIIILYYIIMLL